MAHPIRRKSMEHLEVYDLDKLTLNRSLPPPLPPPRKHRNPLPADFAFKRYQFLCDKKRHETDPVYAATPMFATIPQSGRIKRRRQLLGSRIPTEIIKSIPHTSSESTEPESARTDNDKAKEESSDEDDNQESDNDHDDHDEDREQFSSSSTDDHDDDDYLNNDGDKRGIVEQIFNRHKR